MPDRDQQIYQSSSRRPFPRVDNNYQYLQYHHQQELASQQAGHTHDDRNSISPFSDPLPFVDDSRSSGDAGGTHAHAGRDCRITSLSTLVHDGTSKQSRRLNQGDDQRRHAVLLAAPVSAGGNHQRVDTDTGTSSSDTHSDAKPEIKHKTWFRRNWWWVVPLKLIFVVGIVFYVVKHKEILQGTEGMRKWLARHQAWSWITPVAILIILSFPPLLGHELVQLMVGLAYELPIAIGIACAGAILGELLVFLTFKYTLTDYVTKRCEKRASWAAMRRVLQEAGFRGVLVIRYSAIPPHLASPLFATTGISFWVYMLTVVLSLPKQIVFVILGDPDYKDVKAVSIAKAIAVVLLIIITIWGTRWVRQRLRVAKRDIRAERDQISLNGLPSPCSHTVA